MDFRKKTEKGIRIYVRAMVPDNKKGMDRYDMADIMARLENTDREAMIADYVFGGDECRAVV